MSRIVILGSGTALPDQERDNTSLVWDTPAGALLIDCGGRAFQQLLRAQIDPAKLRALMLTHAHTDHIYGVPALLFHLWLAGYRGSLSIRANRPTLKVAQGLVEALELPQQGHMCAVDWGVIEDYASWTIEQLGGYIIATTPVQHSIPCFGIKIVDPDSGRVLVYSSDTQPCAEIERFAAGAHTLIHEATTDDPDQGYGHSTPYQTGEIAARAGVARLILIHFSAEYTTAEEKAVDEVRAAGFEGEVFIAHDLAEYTL